MSETDIRSTSAHVLPPKSTGCITLDPVEKSLRKFDAAISRLDLPELDSV